MEPPITTDPEATARSLQRRRILEELRRTEESYIADVRFLINVRGCFHQERERKKKGEMPANIL